MTEYQLSPFAPKNPLPPKPIEGVLLNAIACNLKTGGRPDLMLAVMEPGTTVAGVFTQSSTAAAPVDWCQAALRICQPRALIVHAGNANAFTGQKGIKLVEKSAAEVGNLVGCNPEQVFVASTGIIGEVLPEEKILGSIALLHKGISKDNWNLASRSIMTTDTYEKLISREAVIDGERIVITGMAKGAGMIAPDMAILLSFVFTDAKIEPFVLQTLLNEGNLQSFSRVSVDGDTSTNDTLLLFATGTAMKNRKAISDPYDPALIDFKSKLNDLLFDLALQVVRDGEGIQKSIKITVDGARSDFDAQVIARTIANSPLVKAAIGGGTPNWGRVIMAIGRSGKPVNKHRISVSFGPHLLAKDGNPVENYDRDALVGYMQGLEIDVTANVGVGDCAATIWTSDLSQAYVAINADFKT